MYQVLQIDYLVLERGIGLVGRSLQLSRGVPISHVAYHGMEGGLASALLDLRDIRRLG